jgi:hypothetical protein
MDLSKVIVANQADIPPKVPHDAQHIRDDRKGISKGASPWWMLILPVNQEALSVNTAKQAAHVVVFFIA